MKDQQTDSKRMDPTAPPRSKSRSRDRGGSNSRSSGGGKRGMSSKPPTPSTTKTISSSQARKAKLAEEIATLTARVMAEAPPRSRPIPSTKRASSSSSSSAKISSTAAAAATSTSACLSFAALPLSQATHRGLLEASYTTLTAIQQACIPHALAGRDILGAARTGSGKTLAFIVPLMETLFRNQTTPSDGPAAIVLIPTRELAMQIFSVVQRVGKYHVFSVGLLIGGQRDFYTEQEHIASTNILIATPGRLLQHLEQTVNLDMSELRVLVLDEADRILDLGFRDQLMRILDYLPNNNNNDHMNNNNHQSLHQQQQQYPQRQTMLFSATQTRNVQSLATLSLRESPEYLGVHDAEQTETPALLQQSYVVVPVEHKLDAIYSFIKSHLKGKSIVFLSTCAQVRHAHDLLCHLRPGIPVVALHGKLSQERRTQIYLEYTQRTTAAILLATDLAARGLDFPNMDWVVQADAPEDAAMYIHRAGRTARYRSGGKSLLMVTPGEERRGLIDLVVQGGKGGSSGQKGSNDRSGSSGNSGSGKQGAAPKVPIKKLRINPTKATIVTDRSASIVASNVQLNTLAKKAFQSYVRSITLMPHKELFAVEDLDLDAFAKSLGLAATPNLRFLEKAAADRTAFRENKNVNKKLQRLKEQIKAEKLQKKIERLGKQGPASVGKDANVNQLDESDEELLVPKQKRQPLDDNNADDNDDDLPIATQARVSKKIKIDGLFGAGKNHVVFNDHGEVEDFTTMLKPVEAEPQDKHELETATANYLDTVRARLSDTKQRDTADQKERIRQKHKKQRLSEKGTKPNDSPALAILGGFDDDQSNSLNDDGSSADDTTDATSSSSDGDAEPDMKQQEDLVLALIRGNKS